MASDAGDKQDPGNLSADIISGSSVGGGDMTTPFLDALALDPSHGLVMDPNALDRDVLEQNSHGMSFDELWSTDLYQTPDGTNTTQVNHQLNTSEFPTPNLTQSSTLTPSALPPKVGNRFTLDALRSLKDWFSTHVDNPYPTDEEKTILEHQTGLSRVQITNWLANARRRRTISDSRANGNNQPPGDYTPTRSGTPIPRRGPASRDLNPLQRWQNSPPENEPATVSDIARAMGELATTRGRRGTFSSDDKISRRRRHRSTTSSLGTSRSASTDSRSSIGSISGISSHSRGRSIQKSRPQKSSLTKPRFQFQCTFCTETFRRKYDWQRHENSLHLPLDRWECSPNGPTAIDPDTGQMFCLFCGVNGPDANHIASHNPSACQERAFSRKDHLKQHLRLVHNAALTDLTTKLWKTGQPDIKSRCGFCQASLSTWPDRVDHLANHFKLGCTMKSWVGDWGFEDSVLKSIENAMTNGRPPDSPRSAYELITNSHGGSSWLRDLILSTDEIVQQARFAPIRSRAESRLSVLRIKGKNALFEECPLESRLQAFVRSHRVKGIYAISDDELQREAGRIVLQVDSELDTKPEYVANWLIGFLNHSTSWIGEFRRRAGLELASDTQNVLGWQVNALSHPGTLSQEAQTPWSNGNEWLLVEHDELADSAWTIDVGASTNAASGDALLRDFTWLWSDDQSPPAIQSNPSPGAEGQSTLRPTWLGPGIYVLNDPNHIPWFAREMKRWVKAAMSPNNPICHVPSDEELRHHARCLLYNDDDPWNQTPADNAQWLEMFKREVGII
ncbi:hypothetical protein FLONG3_2948 [Fusarium longipes]|uniref:Monocarboxylate transporter 4 n=1 Tax=Fusarium longipes TaxID=694270 RepID=A0A395T3X8_9HYPO|nr:hypothetical protein FLONG3_2948 [Fusarium longipes]